MFKDFLFLVDLLSLEDLRPAAVCVTCFSFGWFLKPVVFWPRPSMAAEAQSTFFVEL